MEWLVSLVGVGLVMAALRDLFHTLWHPTRHGVSPPWGWGTSRPPQAGFAWSRRWKLWSASPS